MPNLRELPIVIETFYDKVPKYYDAVTTSSGMK